MNARLLAFLCALCALGLPLNTAFAYKVLHTSDGHELRWFDSVVPYYINLDGFNDFDPDDVPLVVDECLNTWLSIEFGLTFEFMGFTDIKSAEDDDFNVIFFVQDADTWSDMFNGQGSALGMTRTWALSGGEIKGFDLGFNDAGYTFTNTDDPEMISTDFANMLTHELGHVLGLDHSDISEAVMYSTSPRGETSKRNLHQDDMDGIGYLYQDGFFEDDQILDGLFSCSLRPNTPPMSVGILSLILLSLPVIRLRSRRP